MTSGFTPDATMAGPPPDPTKHVNYTLGMILGVSEFTQESAYLGERDRWAVRDLTGYGTVWGLRVDRRLNGDEPEVMITPGVAVSPRGRLLRVTPAQCAPINDWLKTRTQDLTDRGLPPLGTSTLRLYAVLSYGECETDLLPIPGEPCRSEADSIKPSRIMDDFRLELRFAPPDEWEEDAIRDLVAWLRDHIDPSPVPGSSVPVEVFIAALRDAVVPADPGAFSAPFSPGSPLDFLLDASPAAPFTIYNEDIGEYLREAFRVWVTELRPLRRPNWLGEVHSCSGALAPENPKDGDSVLLAELEVPLTRAIGDSQWFFAAAPGPDRLANLLIREDRRPWLLSTRLLQEWLLAGKTLTGSKGDPGTPGSPDAVLHVAGGSPLTVLAAGWVPADPAAASAGYNGLRAVSIGPGNGQVAFTFTGIVDPSPSSTGNYVVHVTLANPPPPALAPAALSSHALTFMGFRAAGGALPIRFVVELTNNGAPVPDATLNGLFFMIQVSRYQ
jgi:hypothetical protein